MALPEFDPELTSIRAAIACPNGGHFIMSGFPGLAASIDGAPFLDPEAAGATLAYMARARARQLLVLTEQAELPKGAMGQLAKIAKQHGVTLIPLPIPDFSVPDETFMRCWADIGRDVMQHLNAGDSVAANCQHGAGRSGLVAALVLIERGLSPNAAIALVRSHFSEAIENEIQENWLDCRRPELAAPRT